MRRTINGLHGYAILATDGELGKVEEFYFDDAAWVVRYLVVNTGSWLAGRRVLIARAALGKPDWASRRFSVSLTREQVRNSPSTDTDGPVSRAHEIELHTYYEWPFYWGLGMYGSTYNVPNPPAIAMSDAEEATPAAAPPRDPHLRSTRAVTGYYIHARDGDIGHVRDFIVDDDAWELRYLVVSTGHWLPGRKVLLSPKWITSIDWADAKVVVDLPREAIRHSPPYSAEEPPSTEYERQLHAHYGQP